MRKHILYLASGSSRRFGENKLLYEKDGKPLFLHGLEMLQLLVSSRDDCTLAVVSRYEAIRNAARKRNIRTVDSPESEKGVSYTIKAGIAALGSVSQDDYLVFVVADQPSLTPATMEQLLDQADTGCLCARVCHNGRPGNPTLFSAQLLPELLRLEGDTGGSSVLKNYDCIFVEAASPEELNDIDTKQDL